jgi:hypothetical protein
VFISQKTTFFIVTVVRTSNLTQQGDGLNAFSAMGMSQGIAGMRWKFYITCAVFTKFYNMLAWELLATKHGHVYGITG